MMYNVIDTSLKASLTPSMHALINNPINKALGALITPSIPLLINDVTTPIQPSMNDVIQWHLMLQKQHQTLTQHVPQVK